MPVMQVFFFLLILARSIFDQGYSIYLKCDILLHFNSSSAADDKDFPCSVKFLQCSLEIVLKQKYRLTFDAVYTWPPS